MKNTKFIYLTVIVVILFVGLVALLDFWKTQSELTEMESIIGVESTNLAGETVRNDPKNRQKNAVLSLLNKNKDWCADVLKICSGETTPPTTKVVGDCCIPTGYDCSLSDIGQILKKDKYPDLSCQASYQECATNDESCSNVICTPKDSAKNIECSIDVAMSEKNIPSPKLFKIPRIASTSETRTGDGGGKPTSLPELRTIKLDIPKIIPEDQKQPEDKFIPDPFCTSNTIEPGIACGFTDSGDFYYVAGVKMMCLAEINLPVDPETSKSACVSYCHDLDGKWGKCNSWYALYHYGKILELQEQLAQEQAKLGASAYEQKQKNSGLKYCELTNNVCVQKVGVSPTGNYVNAPIGVAGKQQTVICHKNNNNWCWATCGPFPVGGKQPICE